MTAPMVWGPCTKDLAGLRTVGLPHQCKRQQREKDKEHLNVVMKTMLIPGTPGGVTGTFRDPQTTLTNSC